MNHRRFPSSLFPLPIILVLQVMLGIPQSLGNPFEECRYAEFRCGNMSARYPFSGPGIPPGCGHPGLQLDCGKKDITTIEIADVRYQVLEINTEHQKLRIAREDFINNDLCDPEFPDSALDYELFDLVNASYYANVTLLYGCPIPNMFAGHFDCGVNRAGYNYFLVVTEDIDPVQCPKNVTFPILRSSWEENFNFSSFLEGIKKGFEVIWKQDSQACQKCNKTGGACGFCWIMPLEPFIR